MKFQYIKKNVKLFFLLTILIISSCSTNETERLFDDESAVRIEERTVELRDLLKSSTDGWKTTYFTNDKTNGAYGFIFRFKDDKTVEMLSDFSGDGSIVESEYDVNLGATINLVFTSNTLIQDIANNTNEGDFEFLFYGTEGDDIIFRTNRDFKEVRFKKAVAADWVNISKHQDVISKLESSVFGKFFLEGESFDYSYNPATRYFSTSDGSTQFGVGFTPESIVISPALVVTGGTVNEFVYVATDNKYVATLNGTEVASFVFFDAPQEVLPFYDFSVEHDDFRLLRTRESEIPNDRSSNSFLKFYKDWTDSISDNFGGGIIVTHLYIRDTDTPDAYLNIRLTRLSDGVTFNSRSYFTNTRSTDALGNIIVTFNFNSADTRNNDIGIPDLLKPFEDFFFGTSGFYVKRLDPYEPNPSVQNTVGFIPVNDTSMLMHWYDF